MKKQEVINRVMDSESSIFSKEDVIRLINSITSENTLTKDKVDKILDNIQIGLDKTDLVRYDSAEFELSYGNTIELTNIDLDIDEILNIVNVNLEVLIEEEEEEIESE